MIIISQDKTEIINFDNVNTLRATKTGFIVSYENTYKPEDDCSNILGKYETEERAKKILKDLILRYEAIELKKTDSTEKEGYTLSDYTPVFEMPKE